ncbi:MAG: hypothetical protein RR552_08015 [Oscillospiraceae bacterium]
MINKTIEINVSPQNSLNGQEEIAGVMCEHNATELKFVLDSSYINATYKYYLEFVSAVTVSIRTDYLPIVGNAVTFTIPAEISSLLNVDCYFNVVKVTNGITEMLIKPARINLDFCKVFDANNDMLSNYDFSINALLDAIKKGAFKGDKGDKGDTGYKGDKGDKGDVGSEARKSTMRVDAPPFTVQPTFSGVLNPAFKTWIYTHYYVHIVDEVAGIFKLMPNKNDVANAIAQEFTMPNFNTGNWGILKENDAVDFLEITPMPSAATKIVMRKAGFNTFIFSGLNCNEIEILGNGFCNSSGYFLMSYINGFNSENFKYVGTVGTYKGNSGFLTGTSAKRNKNVLNVFSEKLIIGDNMLTNNFFTTIYTGSDDDRSILTSNTTLSGSGSAFKDDFSPINQTFSSFRFTITEPFLFLNGFELTIIKRSR